MEVRGEAPKANNNKQMTAQPPQRVPIDFTGVFPRLATRRRTKKSPFAGAAANGTTSNPADAKRNISDREHNKAYDAQSKGQIGQFFDALFRHADPETFVSLRAFGPGGKPKLVRGVKVGDAAAMAAEVAAGVTGVVFAPPVCTFDNADSATEDHVADGLAISVDIDSNPTAAWAALEDVLGVATVVVASGSEWIDAKGKRVPKQHMHWRLAQPAHTLEERTMLKEARWLAAALVGADRTAAPLCHPLRWPGTLNAKRAPAVMARIVEFNPEVGIDLANAHARLAAAVESAGLGMPPSDRPAGEPTAPIADVASALAAIHNDNVDWDAWNRLGMATFAASGGSAQGLAAWGVWSAKSAKHQSGACEVRWDHYGTSPPTSLGAGTIFYLAREAGWRRSDRFTRASGDLPLVQLRENTSCLDVRDFVQGLLIEQSSIVVYGETNSGKTFWTTDLALHIAAGLPWNGRRVERGGVIYCILEGGVGFRNRVAAWLKQHGLDGEGIPFASIPASLNLLDPEADTARLISAIQRQAEFVDVAAKLVVVDTLFRALAGGNENAPEHMGALVRNMDRIRKETGSAVLFVHHSGKDQAKGSRGHSSLPGAIDTEIEVVVADGDAKTATVVKQRELKSGDRFRFALKEVELGKNRYGEMITTCVVLPVAGEVTPKMNPRDELAVRALRIAIDKEGVRLSGSHGAKSVSDERWRDEFYQLKGGPTDSKKHALSRSKKSLEEGRVIATGGDLVWFVVDEPAGH
ncbi:MAG: AAA family ATPase [Acetobacteraceae bacterium]